MTKNDVTRAHVSGTDLEVTPFHQMSDGRGCRKPKTWILCTFELLHGCNSQEVVVM